ncbi:MAG: hypothetical protein PHC88_05510 [Terrimicrobiaceae bacterium]|nr:hypothetical protein [Terrimicrobiaceae bacterium]
MIPNTKPDALGLYWKAGKIYFKTSPAFFLVMIPAMIGTYMVLAWAAGVLLSWLFLG